MEGFDRRRARRYALITTVKIAILYIMLLMLCMYALGRVYEELDVAERDRSLVAYSLIYLLPFLLFPLVAYAAGGFEPGDRRRLAGRCAMAVFLAVLLFLRPEDLTYGISDVLIDRTSGAYAEGMELMMSIEGFMILLSPIPVFTTIDAILEYRHPATSV